MGYLKKCLDITMAILVESYPWFIIGAAVIGGLFDFLSSNVGSYTFSRLIESSKIAIISAALMIAITFVFYAPYQIWREGQKELKAAQDEKKVLEKKISDKERIKNIISQLTTFSKEAQALEQKCWKGDQNSQKDFEDWNQKFSTYMYSNGEGANFVRSDNQSLVPLWYPPPLLPSHLKTIAWWWHAKQYHIDRFIIEYNAMLRSN